MRINYPHRAAPSRLSDVPIGGVFSLADCENRFFLNTEAGFVDLATGQVHNASGLNLLIKSPPTANPAVIPFHRAILRPCVPKNFPKPDDF